MSFSENEKFKLLDEYITRKIEELRFMNLYDITNDDVYNAIMDVYNDIYIEMTMINYDSSEMSNA